MSGFNDGGRIVTSLRGLVNDQFYSTIRFCLGLPFGGVKLAEGILRDLARVHSRSSLASPEFMGAYGPAPAGMTPAQALGYVFDIHAKEHVIRPDWVTVTESGGGADVSYNREGCVYNAHCTSLVCDGFDCLCVRRFFCEGIVKELTGQDMESTILTPRMDSPVCRFSLRPAKARDEEESARVIREIQESAAQNARLMEAVRMKTEILEAQKTAIRESEARIRAITAASADAIVILNTGGEAVFWNPAAERMFGYSSAEIVGRDVSGYVVPPVYTARFRGELARLRQGEAAQARQGVLEAEGMRKGRELFPVEASLSTVTLDGLPHAMAIIRDVTERKKAEWALKQLVRETAHVTGDDFFNKITESLSRLLGVKYAFISRIADESSKTLQTVTMYGGGAIQPNFQYGFEGTPCEVVVKERRLVTFPTQVAQRFPQDLWLAQNSIDSYAAIPLSGSKGEFLGHMGVMDERPFQASELNMTIMRTFADRVAAEMERARGETERKELDEKIRQTQKLESLGILAGGIAHDFNNLLTTIMGDCDLAVETLPADSAARGIIADLKTTAKHAADLAHQMLAYSGRGKFNISDVNLTEVIKGMGYLLSRSIPKKAVLRHNLEENVPMIRADLSQLRQVILNLVINAAEALENAEGVIGVSTGVMECKAECLKGMYLGEDLPGGLYVTMEISDTGKGMDEKTVSRIFDPFFTTKFTGRGLGLSAVLGIIRGHKGAIKIDSAPGKGSRFLALFPATGTGLAEAAKMEQASASAKLGSGLALLVDDEDIVRNVAEKMLRLAGFAVIQARDGVEAVDIFEKRGGEINLALLDLTMPRMDGLECLKRLKEIRASVPVIISSGYDESEVSHLFAGLGAAAFLQKPFDMAMLRGAVARALRA